MSIARSKSDHLVARVVAAAISAIMMIAGAAAQDEPLVKQYIADIQANELVPGATGFGELRPDIPVVPVLRDAETIGWAFLTSDFVPTTGFSGKPIHILMAVDRDARIIGAKLVKHSEPIVLVGIPNEKILAVTKGHVGLDLREVARSRQSQRKLDIISGATVTVMVIDDSIVRAGLRVAHSLELGGFKKITDQAASAKGGLQMSLDEPGAAETWRSLISDGSVRTLKLTVGQVNDAFDALGDERAREHRSAGPPDALFAEVNIALVSQPTIGRSLLGDAEYNNLEAWLGAGEQAILIAGRGDYSYKGSGYVRGGIFDRIKLIQGDNSVRFTDKLYKRLGAVAAAGTPAFIDADIFKIPADAGFDPVKPFRLQLLVQRAVGPIQKLFTTFDLNYQLPAAFIIDPRDAGGGDMTHLWKRIWRAKQIEVAILAAAIAVITGVFFFQMELTRNERRVYWFRIGFLSFTLVFIGWIANAQLSVVNIFTFANAAMTKFSWNAFLMDPLIFILWFSVAAALIFWGRGAYCGWLCPFGALQELTNKIGRIFKIPQIRVPWAIHERLWPVKYMIFLVLFGMSLYSLEMAERFSEIEPFKTAIILKFARSWPFVLFAVALLAAGLFIERFYCRYLCPLGAALAIPGRLRMFDWLRRYRDCGNPCQRCANECFVQAIHPEGHINPNECHQCLHCQVLYQSASKCPVCIKRTQKLERLRIRAGDAAEEITAARPDPHRRQI